MAERWAGHCVEFAGEDKATGMDECEDESAVAEVVAGLQAAAHDSSLDDGAAAGAPARAEAVASCLKERPGGGRRRS